MPNQRIFPERITFEGEPQSIFVPYIEGNLPANHNGNIRFVPMEENGQRVWRAVDRNPTAVVFRPGYTPPAPIQVAPPPPRPPPPVIAPRPGYVWPQGYSNPIPVAAYNPPPPPRAPPAPPGARVVQAPPPMTYNEAIAYQQRLQQQQAIPMANQVPAPALYVVPEQFWGEDHLVRVSKASQVADYYDAQKAAALNHILGPH